MERKMAMNNIISAANEFEGCEIKPFPYQRIELAIIELSLRGNLSSRKAVPKNADQLANDGPIPPRGCGNEDRKIVPSRPLLN